MLEDACINKYGTTDLHVAAGMGYARTLSLLLKSGKDPNTQNYFGLTPLHTAALNGELECVELLVFYNACPSITDILGQTAQEKVSIALSYKSSFNQIALDEFREVLTFLTHHTVRSLKLLCRQVIRDCMTTRDNSTIVKLPIPRQVQQFLLYTLSADVQNSVYRSSTLATHPVTTNYITSDNNNNNNNKNNNNSSSSSSSKTSVSNNNDSSKCRIL